jgi:hypothetical protein
MGLKNSGKLDERSAPYFRYLAASVAMDCTEVTKNSRGATSGIVCLGAGNRVIEDAEGVVSTIILPANTIDTWLPIAVCRVDVSNAVPLVLFWHPRGGAS